MNTHYHSKVKPIILNKWELREKECRILSKITLFDDSKFLENQYHINGNLEIKFSDKSRTSMKPGWKPKEKERLSHAIIFSSYIRISMKIKPID